MVVSIVHKGLRIYYEQGMGLKLPAAQLGKIRRVLDMLDAVATEDDIKALGYNVHKLKGEYANFWSLTITGNYRIIFRFYAGDVHDVDYLDYH